MRVAIYNRYWNTRGGGERYAGAIAQAMARQYPVQLLGPESVDLESLTDHLGLDLSQTSYLQWPASAERHLSPLTSDYDLFFNCTFGSALRSRARRSVYVVLFPQRLFSGAFTRIAAQTLGALQFWSAPSIFPVRGFHRLEASGNQWSGERSVIAIRGSAFRRGKVAVPFRSATPWPLAEAVRSVKAPGIRWSVSGDQVVLETESKPAPLTHVQIECKTFSPKSLGISNDTRQLGVCLLPGDFARVRNYLQRGLAHVDRRVASYDPKFIESYDLLIAISRFTQEWVRKRWRAESEILHPPLDTAAFATGAAADKERVVLSVGRFFSGSHNKKHVQMLKVFRGMCDRGDVPDGWEYHLAGNLHRNRLSDLEYFAELQRLATGYPVRFMVDLPLEDLRREYKKAAIFWHAAGWGERRPEKLEHFGITTCEAMYSGCVPVVIAKAGQLEIVDHGRTGFLFSNAGELASTTTRLMLAYGEPWMHQLMDAAISRAKLFDTSEFDRNLLRLLRDHNLLG
jgi:glycosyltransferase involved in cell wall biosynthesis